MGVGTSKPGVEYNLVVRRFLSPSEKRSIRVGVTQFSRCRQSPLSLTRKGNSLTPCASQVSEMNPVPQMKMQKSPSSASLTLGAVDWSCSYSAILAPLLSGI
ncbi:T0011406 isoform 2 [Pan troglodytes]|uniref:T0011406 isoform 2 n=1 Tax=Pan troglodytes TaxID=9598 RepID=A0A2J8PEY3_PANTR|nr:T0011406 isoform 2 [Pan troglodytes]